MLGGVNFYRASNDSRMGFRSLESAGQTTDSKAPKNSRIFIGFVGPQAHEDSVENSLPVGRGSVTRRSHLPSRDRQGAIAAGIFITFGGRQAHGDSLGARVESALTVAARLALAMLLSEPRPSGSDLSILST